MAQLLRGCRLAAPAAVIVDVASAVGDTQRWPYWTDWMHLLVGRKERAAACALMPSSPLAKCPGAKVLGGTGGGGGEGGDKGESRVGSYPSLMHHGSPSLGSTWVKHCISAGTGN